MKTLKAIVLAVFLTVSAAGFAFASGGGNKLSGDKILKQNCNRCHFLPQFKFAGFKDYSKKQLKTIVMHMRVRANLTGDEAKALVKFLTQ